MRKYLCIIPDCVVNAVGSNVIIYEPIQKDFAIFKRENKNGQNYNNYIIDNTSLIFAPSFKQRPPIEPASLLR